MVDINARYTQKKLLTEVTEAEVREGITESYKDICNRKGAIYFRSIYCKTLLDNSDVVAKHLQNGGGIHVF